MEILKNIAIVVVMYYHGNNIFSKEDIHGICKSSF